MTEYQKFMFDNFVISCNDDECFAEGQELLETEIDDEAVMQESVSEIAQNEKPEESNNEEDTNNENIEAIDTISDVEEDTVRFSQEELDVAVAEAENKGYEKGVAEIKNNLLAKQTELWQKVEAHLQNILIKADDVLKEAEDMAVKVALEAVCKILPTIEKDVAKKEVEAFLSDNFANFRGESNLSFSFHPEMAAEIAPRLSKLAEQNDFEGKIAIHKDMNLSYSDCKVEWKNGGVEKNITENLAKVEDLILK